MIFDRFLVEGVTVFFRTMLFFFKVVGEKAVSTNELTEFCQTFESEMTSFSDYFAFRTDISSIYINQQLLNKARRIEYDSLIKSQTKTTKQKKQGVDKCIDESPFCFGTRHFRTQKETNFCTKSSNYVDKIKFNYFDPFSCRNASLSSNPIPSEEMLNLKHLTNQFTSYRNGNGCEDDLPNDQPDLLQIVPSFEKQLSFHTSGTFKKPVDSFNNFDQMTSQNNKSLSKPVELPPAGPLMKMHTTKDDTLFVPHFGKVHSHVGYRFDNSFKSAMKSQGFSREENLEESSSFFKLLKQDSEKIETHENPKPEFPPTDLFQNKRATPEVNRLKPSKSESHAHRFFGCGFEPFSEQQKKKQIQESELILVRTDHICHLRRLSYLRLKDQKRIKQLFFEKTKRLIKKQLGWVISAHFYQNENKFRKMKTIKEEKEEIESNTISKLLSSSNKLNNHSISANDLRPCRSQERKASTHFETTSDALPKTNHTLSKQTSEFPTNLPSPPLKPQKKPTPFALSKHKSTKDVQQRSANNLSHNESSQLALKQPSEPLLLAKKKPLVLSSNLDAKDKTRKPPAKASK